MYIIIDYGKKAGKKVTDGLIKRDSTLEEH